MPACDTVSAGVGLSLDEVPRHRVVERTLHLLLLRDAAAAIPLPTPSEDA